MQETLKATITFEYEYEADTYDYKVNTVEEMCKMDVEVIKDDPGLFIADAKIFVKVEKVS